MNTQEFLETHFADKPENHHIVIFTLPNQVSRFFQHIEEAAKYADSQREVKNQHLYFCTNFLHRKPAKGRGAAKDSGGVSCFYMDVDIDSASPTHTKSDLPKSEAEAIELVKSIGIDPSMVVHSGYGLHVYWIFKEPLLFESDEDRERYHKLLLRLQATVKAKAALKGWTLDSTGDLARILRVPTSFNWKIPDRPMEVRVVEHRPELRYDPADIEPYLVDETHIRRAKMPESMRNQTLQDITLNRDANPPLEKFEALCEIEENFARSWKARRTEFGSDPSRYIQSLANYAARANWTRQEMCDLLIAFYRRHLDNPLFLIRAGREPISMERIMRPIKITHTINNAILAAEAGRTGDEQDQGQNPDQVEAEAPAPATEEPTEATTAPEKKEHHLKMISGSLRINVLGIKRFIPEEGNDNVYVLQIEKDGKTQDIKFKDIQQLHKQPLFNLRITDCIKIVPKSVENDVWGRVRRAFTDITEDVFISPEAVTTQGKLKIWLEEYLQNKPPLTAAQGKQMHQPFVHDGQWHIYAKPFADWCFQYKAKGDALFRHEIDLEEAGIHNVKVQIPKPDNPKERNSTKAYRVPCEILAPPTRPKLVVDNTRTEDVTDDADMEDAEATP